MSSVESFSLEKGRGGGGTGLERSTERITLLRMVFGCAAIGALLAAALFAPWIAPHDPTLDDLFLINMPPAWLNDDLAYFGIENAWAYPLGTDSLGRDVASRLIYGARLAMIVGVSVACLAALAGVILGALAGFYGGWIDNVISRIVDVWLSFPPVLLSIILVAMLGTTLTSVIIVVAVIDWTRFARVVRADVLQQRSRDYIDAARIAGGSDLSILIREVLPNVLPLLVTLFFFEIGIAITVETILSFVSLSVSSGAATWGDMIAEGRRVINEAWWVMAFPVGALVITILGLNAMGDALRFYLDPVLRK
ncbi:MAG: ABC transporter permease [Boseongicola sp. SB0675_bin_26]|nr:ABC transporter permease [Boseongicola sp. SB0675_bin_26]